MTTSEEVGSSAVESEESVEVLVQDEATPTGEEMLQMPTTEEVVEEVGGVSEGRGSPYACTISLFFCLTYILFS